jgi:tRNA G46 methylase TrmB
MFIGIIYSDNVDFMFLSKLLDGSLTLHKFNNPPRLTLDLGCGGGLWCIEAAKRWPVSILILR